MDGGVTTAPEWITLVLVAILFTRTMIIQGCKTYRTLLRQKRKEDIETTDVTNESTSSE